MGSYHIKESSKVEEGKVLGVEVAIRPSHKKVTMTVRTIFVHGSAFFETSERVVTNQHDRMKNRFGQSLILWLLNVKMVPTEKLRAFLLLLEGKNRWCSRHISLINRVRGNC